MMVKSVKLKKILSSLSNVGWVATSIRPSLSALVIIIIAESLSSLASVFMAVESKNLIDAAVQNDLNRIFIHIALFIGIVLYNQASYAFLSVYSTRTKENYSNAMRQGIFSRLMNTEWMQVSRYHSGDLLTRLTSDINSVTSGSISILPSIVGLGVQLAAAFVTLMLYEPALAVLAFITAPLTVILGRVYASKIKKTHIKIQEVESSYRSRMQEFLQNLLILKTFNLEEHSKEKIAELQKERLHWITERSKAGVVSNTLLSLGYWLGYILAFVWGVIKLAGKTATFGVMTAFLQLVGQIQGPFIGLSRTVPQIISALASAGRLIELEKLDAERVEGQVEPPESAGISINEVSFKYEKDEQVLDAVSMEANPGEVVAIIGPSGEGKTTIVRLMLALLKPDTGNITCFDGSGKILDASAATRNWFTYVPQGNTLFSGTIADNLRSGDKEADDEEMWAALNAAGAGEFVERLPNGIDTAVGEKAYGLSEGQAQRIAIARAILRKAPVIILDEATSALDIELEEKVLKNIRNIRPARTCIMITHRKTALGTCNSIYSLKDGALYLEKKEANLVS